MALVGENARWDEGGQPFWQGEVEECINGRTVADGAYFGIDVGPIVERLLGERQPDGGWNCERANGSARTSFDTTINVVEGLLEYERATGGAPAVRAARRSGEAFLLERALFRRLSTGEPADPDFLLLWHPNRWRHDILRGLDHFRAASLVGRRRPPTRGSARRSPRSAGGGCPTGAGRSTGRRAGASGSRWTNRPGSRRGGSRCARCEC